jgi:hypothetical protein
VTGEGADNHARFNMPLEWGRHAPCALSANRQGFSYHKYVSDLAGFDPGMHSYSVESVIREVAARLRLQKNAIDPAPSALRIDREFASFRTGAAELRAEALEKETWADLLLAAIPNGASTVRMQIPRRADQGPN